MQAERFILDPLTDIIIMIFSFLQSLSASLGILLVLIRQNKKPVTM